MQAIRGATTVACDSAEEIKSSVKELLDEIMVRNGLEQSDIVCIMFSNTSDLHSFYPAKAAREAGYFGAALFSSLEPEISGALERCIRVMLLVNGDKAPEHVYLKGAANLRRDISKKINIAVDGPAGSGKSTVCSFIAEKLKILCLDTGAMYRACALKCIEEKVSANDEKVVDKLVEKVNIEVKYDNGAQRTFLDGKDVTEKIRTPEISMAASKVSSYASVRKKMVELQREIAKTTSCILDGRDIGTNVLPDAKFKFYLTANAEIRAERRYKELKAKGLDVKYEDLKREILQRDEQDKSREIAPLKMAEDAVLVDTSKMNIDEVVAFICNKIQEKI